MAIAFATAWTGIQGNSVLSVTATAIASTGNFIGVSATDNNAFAATPVSDTKTNTWQKSQGPTAVSTDNVSQYYAENATTGVAHQITLTSAVGSSFLTLCAASYSALATSGTIDQIHSGSGNSTALDSGATPATVQANELCLLAGTISTGFDGVFTGGSGFTVRSSTGAASVGGTGFIADKVVSATGAQQGTCGWSNAAGTWVCLISTHADTPIGGDVLRPQACF